LMVLSMSLDTRNANPTARLTLTILAAIAAWEREIMLERQREGIAKAKGEGKYKGRKPTVALQAVQIRELHAAGGKPAHIARRLGVARSSVYRMLEVALGPSDRSPQAVTTEVTGREAAGGLPIA
jgi:DNA invertase Pin-like site-specific DNA recombinase